MANTRKFKLDDKANLAQLQKELQRLLGQDSTKITISYADSDGEMISVLSDEDWIVCVEEFAIKNKDKPVLTVVIHVIEASTISKLGSINQSVSQSVSEYTDIEEEPKPAAPTVEQAKVIEEVIPETSKETKPAEKVAEEPAPRSIFEDEPAREDSRIDASPEDVFPDTYISCQFKLDNLNDLTAALNNMIPGVDVVSARIVEEDKPAEAVNESLSQSTLTVDMKKEIESLVDQRVSQILSTRNVPTPTAVCSGKFVHHGIFCDGCKSKIVDQPRYKS